MYTQSNSPVAYRFVAANHQPLVGKEFHGLVLALSDDEVEYRVLSTSPISSFNQIGEKTATIKTDHSHYLVHYGPFLLINKPPVLGERLKCLKLVLSGYKFENESLTTSLVCARTLIGRDCRGNSTWKIHTENSVYIAHELIF